MARSKNPKYRSTLEECLQELNLAEYSEAIKLLNSRALKLGNQEYRDLHDMCCWAYWTRYTEIKTAVEEFAFVLEVTL